ncbi:MAG: DUF6198 family protein [Lachnospiraceae bacterium]|nr:DUF6198 family protein [Lachnospiraceae bacterium]
MNRIGDVFHRFPMGEMAYIFGMLLNAMGIALQTKAGLGLSMVAAPAYLLSMRVPWLSFGMGECIVQGSLFLLCCVWTGRFLKKQLWSFVVAIPYGWILDQMLQVFADIYPIFLWEKMIIYLLGSLTLAAGISLFFQSYLPCQVYEMFVKCIAQHTGKPFSSVKQIYDWSSLGASFVLSLLFFHRIIGIGIGTVLCTLINAPLIRIFEKMFCRIFNFRPAFPAFIKIFN